MAWLLKKEVAANVTTPDANHIAQFADSVTSLPKYKNSAGVVADWTGPQGVQGIQGITGAGVPAGGATGAMLQKVDGTDYNTSWLTTTAYGRALLALANATGLTALLNVATSSVAGLMSAANFNKLAGLMVDVKTDFGGVMDGVADDTTACQNAINFVQGLGGGIVLFRGRAKITSTLLVSGNGVCLMGLGGSHTCDVGNYVNTAPSWIVWGGSGSNIAVKAAPPVGAGNQALIGFQFVNLNIDCRNGDANQATIGLQMLSCHGFVVSNFFIIDPITAGIDMNVVATLGEARDCTRGVVSRGAIRCLDGASAGAIGIRLDGDTGANTCCNHFDTIQIMHAGSSGNAAIEFLNADSNKFFNCYVNRSSGTNPGWRFNGSNSSASLVARNNTMDHCSAGLGGVVSRATGLTFPALDNYAPGYEVGNGEPIPTIEAGSSFYFYANGTQNGGAFSTFMGNIPSMKLNANFTTTIATNTNTNLQFYAQPNEVWKLTFKATAQCSSTGGSKYQITAPAGSTVEGWLKSSAAAITTLSYQRITAINTLNATALHTVATTPGPDEIEVMVAVGATGGVIAIGAASVTATQTTTIFAGSTLAAIKLNGV